MMKLTFYGGAESVTGANFLLEDDKNKLLVDCGLFQGESASDEKNNAPFGYDASSVDALFITHAHLDHVGRIPKLIQEGFEGKIIGTPPTRDLTELILLDSARVLEYEAKKRGEKAPYGEEEVKKAMSLWETLEYHTPRSLKGGLTVKLKRTGHILGSSMVEFDRDGKSIVFTGDIGNSPTPLLRDTEYADGATYLVMESVYGDREHEERDKRREKLKTIIQENTEKNGVLLIPAFSLERTQELLFEIEEMIEGGELDPVSVFIDSPLAIKITHIYTKYKNYFNKDVQGLLEGGDTLFSFKGLKLTLSGEESRDISKEKNPKIIIAGSGMSSGGRILHHEKRYLTDPSTTLLMVNYQAPGTLGRRIEEGEKTVMIDDTKVEIRAQVKEVHGYSSHADKDALLSFVEKSGEKLMRVFPAMGEPRSSMLFAQRIKDELGIDAKVPREYETVDIEI